MHEFVFPKIVSTTPIPDAYLVVTDGFSNGKAAHSIQGKVTVPGRPLLIQDR